MSAETSYSRYQNYKNGVSGYTLDLANTSGTGDSVMNIKGNVTISNDILGNSNYTSLISATLKYDGLSMLTSPTVTTNVFTPNTLENNTGLLNGSDVISQGWGQHTVAASFTFDGVNASNGTSSLQCHVTGIPYSVTFNKNKDINGWTFSNIEHPSGATPSTSYIAFKPTNAYAKSPAFTIPKNIDVTIQLGYAIYSSVVLWSGYNKYSPTIYVDTISGDATPSSTGSNFSCGSTSNNNQPDKRLNNISVTNTFSVDNRCLSIYVYGEKDKSTSIDRTTISSCTIEYR